MEEIKVKKVLAGVILVSAIVAWGVPFASAQSCAEFVSRMKGVVSTIEDGAKRREFEESMAKAESQLKAFQYLDCVQTAREALRKAGMESVPAATQQK